MRVVFRSGITWLLTGFVLFASAQNQERYLPAWELGLSAGAYVYQGDLTPDKIGSLKTITPGLQITAGKYITNSLFVRTGFTAAVLRGHDHLYGNKEAYRYYRNYYFRSLLAELHTTVSGYLFNSKVYEQKLHPYLVAGAGLVFLNNKPGISATDFSYFPQSDLPARLGEDFQKNRQRLFITTIAGAGIKYDMSTTISFTTELQYRFGFTDYIDGFSVAANSDKNDHYYSLQVGVVFKFADDGLNLKNRKKLRCWF